MLTLISAWFRSSWLSIAKWGGIALGVLLVLLKARQSGKDAVRVETLEKDLESAKKTIADADSINRADPDRLRRGLNATLRRKLGSDASDG